jgi:hypothetical protein
MKPVELSGTKKGECMKEKVNDLEKNSKNKNIKDSYRGINGF